MSNAILGSTVIGLESCGAAFFGKRGTVNPYTESGRSSEASRPEGRSSEPSKHRTLYGSVRTDHVTSADRIAVKNTRSCVPPLGSTRIPTSIWLAIAIVATTGTAWAEEDPDACISTHADAQVLAKAGKMIEARKKFALCATEACPKVIQKDCKNLGMAVEKWIPTLRLGLMEHDGTAVKDFRAEVDGVAIAPEVANQPIPVDPGERRIRFSASDHPATDVTVPVKKGDKDRSVVVQFAEADPVAAKARIAGYSLAGVGAFAFISFVAFGISGYLDQEKLEDSPPRAGNRDDLATIDSMRRNYVLADVSLGLSLVSLGAATYLLYVTKDAGKRAPSRAPVALDVRGYGSGAAAFVSAEF